MHNLIMRSILLTLHHFRTNINIDLKRTRTCASQTAALGVVLGALAQRHREAQEAVVAEGLFRAALEKLSGPYALHDPGSQAARARALESYGELLGKWERREAEGADMRAQAQMLRSARGALWADDSPLLAFVVPSLL